jgi:CheY-like chemotaxis protein
MSCHQLVTDPRSANGEGRDFVHSGIPVSAQDSSPRLKPYGSTVVLVADDDLETRAATTEILIDAGYVPATARNGLEALEHLRAGLRPAVLVVDLYMPLMDGEALCRALDQDPQHALIPRILLSGNEAAASRQSACGAVFFISKPVDGEKLIRAVEHAVRTAAPRPVPVS